MKETIGNWIANRYLDGFEVQLIDSKKINNMNIIKTWGAFDATGNLVDNKTHNYN